ncbi:phosphopentomutase [Anaerorhabdus sp.]|uniref:phosphopentomutase n=1 Tax=Anaerorhabdus sp. TaxID=1872524 RepID=UPI002B20983C|nr:phosphopentomutase [Anaerorhabdus sp.]MEA4875004.1 phosphopentomutase [Anaerorhabdus sp.]
MMKYNRIFTIVMDSVGAGAMPDAAKYGDEGADTIGHTAEAVGGLKMPVMQAMGLGNLHKIKGVDPVQTPTGYYTKLLEKSVGKDTMTGHWEMMGLYIDSPFQTFTETGFPDELIKELEEKTGHKVIGNKSASGTEILDELGERHMQTGEMIVYTSADSVLQIAAHEETFGLDELYRCCEIAREITMKPEWKVGRVIARPFLGDKAGNFSRTPNRHDLALKPYGKTTLNSLKDAGYDVISVGKINDIFVGEGITDSHKSLSSIHGMEQTIELADKDFKGLCFVNLVDFDAKWGHRRNPQGYAKELDDFDVLLGQLINKLNEDDLVILTADHGNDPTHPGTDHTREMIPMVAYSKSFKGAGLIRQGSSFADIGATISDNFNVELPENGDSFLDSLN